MTQGRRVLESARAPPPGSGHHRGRSWESDTSGSSGSSVDSSVDVSVDDGGDAGGGIDAADGGGRFPPPAGGAALADRRLRSVSRAVGDFAVRLQRWPPGATELAVGVVAVVALAAAVHPIAALASSLSRAVRGDRLPSRRPSVVAHLGTVAVASVGVGGERAPLGRGGGKGGGGKAAPAAAVMVVVAEEAVAARKAR